ncbi:hypothetical protein [Bradyrhizobium sp. ORS 86]
MRILADIIVAWLALNALVFAWLNHGRYVRWPDLRFREVRRRH